MPVNIPWITAKTSFRPLPNYPYNLLAPIPSIGTSGPFLFNYYDILGALIKKGDEVIIVTGGVRYSYFAIADVYCSGIDTPSPTQPKSITVSPNVLVAHSAGDQIILPAKPYSRRVGGNVIGPHLPVSVGWWRPSSDAEWASYVGSHLPVPYVRPWPDSVDPQGVPWDKDSLYALSITVLNSSGHASDTFVSRTVFDTGTQANYTVWNYTDMMPVPRSPGVEYTRLGVRDWVSFGLVRTPSTVKYRQVSLSPQRYAWRTWGRSAGESEAQWHNRLSPPNNDYVPGEDLSWDAGTGVISHPTLARWQTGRDYGQGVRGGRYSLSGYASTGAGFSGFTIEVWMSNPGGSDILLHSIPVTLGAVPGGDSDVVTGAWSGVHYPATSGTAVALYCKLTGVSSPTAVHMRGMSFDNGHCLITVFPTTQVPYHTTVITGNTVAPGGLIAPFY